MRSSQLDGARRTLEADANNFSRDTAKGKANPLGAEMLRQGVALIDASSRADLILRLRRSLWQRSL